MGNLLSFLPTSFTGKKQTGKSGSATPYKIFAGIGKSASKYGSKVTSTAASRTKANAETNNKKYEVIYKIVTTLGGYAASLGFFLFGLIASLVLRIIFNFLPPAWESALDNVIAVWRENYENKRNRLSEDSWLYYISVPLLALFDTIAVIFYAYVVLWLKYLVSHFFLLFTMLSIGLIMYLLRTTMPVISTMYGDASTATVEGYNAGVSVVSTTIDVQQIFAPLSNVATYTTVMTLFAVEKGVREAMGYTDPGLVDETENPISSRRQLSDSTTDVVEVIVAILCQMSVAMMKVTIVLIDVFFKIIFPVFYYLLDAFIFVIQRLACFLAGWWCSILEVFDATLNLLLVPINMVIAVLGWHWEVNTACGDDVLADKLRVPCECSGNFFDFSSPGMFKNLQVCGGSYDDPEQLVRRLLTETSVRGISVRCYQTDDGDYVEESGDISLHRTSELSMACPTAKRSFHPYSHSVDMQRFDTHGCIHHCVMGVAYQSCDVMNHTLTLLGSCDGSETTEGTAKEKISFLNVDLDKLKTKPERRPRSRKLDSSKTAAERISTLRSTIPQGKFYVTWLGECDLGRPPEDIFEVFDGMMCIFGFLSKDTDISSWATSNGRRQLATEEDAKYENGGVLAKAAERILLDMSHWARQTKRASEVKDRRELYEPHDIVSISDILDHMKRQKQSGRRSLAEVNKVQIDPDAPIGCMEPYIHTCPDLQFCVNDLKYCSEPTDWNMFTTFSYYAQAVGQSASGFDAQKELMEFRKCYEQREQEPKRNPYTFGNLFRDSQDIINDQSLIYCTGEIAPTNWRPTTTSYTPKSDLETFCTGSEEYNGCRCPDFYSDTQEDANDTRFVSNWLLRILFNGLKWFIYMILILANVVFNFFVEILDGVGWDFSKLRSSSYGLSDNEFLVCVAIHTGDAAILVVVVILCIGLIKSTWFLIDYYEDYYFEKRITQNFAKDPNASGSIIDRIQKSPLERMKFDYEIKWKPALVEKRDVSIKYVASEQQAAERFRTWLENEEKVSSDRIEMPHLTAKKQTRNVPVKHTDVEQPKPKMYEIVIKHPNEEIEEDGEKKD